MTIGRAVAIETDTRVPTLVATASQKARATADATSHAYPLVLAGMVVGVLHVATPAIDPDTEHALDALLSTAAAALESARLHSVAEENAGTDALTQLPNRRRMETDLDREWDTSRRHGKPLSFIMVDLDHFKRLNDEYGHPVGDTVLHAAAAAVRASLRATDTAYRYGGEELAIVLRETSLDEAPAIAERIRAAIAAVTVEHTTARVTASLGLAERTSDMRFHVDLVAAADAALYTAKRMGRDRVVTHSVALMPPAPRKAFPSQRTPEEASPTR